MGEWEAGHGEQRPGEAAAVVLSPARAGPLRSPPSTHLLLRLVVHLLALELVLQGGRWEAGKVGGSVAACTDCRPASAGCDDIMHARPVPLARQPTPPTWMSCASSRSWRRRITSSRCASFSTSPSAPATAAEDATPPDGCEGKGIGGGQQVGWRSAAQQQQQAPPSLPAAKPPTLAPPGPRPAGSSRRRRSSSSALSRSWRSASSWSNANCASSALPRSCSRAGDGGQRWLAAGEAGRHACTNRRPAQPTTAPGAGRSPGGGRPGWMGRYRGACTPPLQGRRWTKRGQ